MFAMVHDSVVRVQNLDYVMRSSVSWRCWVYSWLEPRSCAILSRFSTKGRMSIVSPSSWRARRSKTALSSSIIFFAISSIDICGGGWRYCEVRYVVIIVAGKKGVPPPHIPTRVWPRLTHEDSTRKTKRIPHILSRAVPYQ